MKIFLAAPSETPRHRATEFGLRKAILGQGGTPLTCDNYGDQIHLRALIEQADVGLICVDDFAPQVMFAAGALYAAHVPTITYSDRHFGLHPRLRPGVIAHTTTLAGVEDVIDTLRAVANEPPEAWARAVGVLQSRYLVPQTGSAVAHA